MFKSKKSLIIFIVVIVLLVLAFGFYVYSELNISKKPWSVVYLTTGEIYVGKVSHFPKLQLFDAYILQIVTPPEAKTEEGIQEKPKTSFQLTPLKDALWAPKKLYLNPKQVVFYGPIEENSKVAEAIRGAAK